MTNDGFADNKSRPTIGSAPAEPVPCRRLGLATDSIKQARSIVADLFEPRPILYWADFFGSMIVAYGCATLVLSGHLEWAVGIPLYLIAVVALYRLSLFMHEISHFRRGEMRTFKIVWNLLAGIPMLVPSFLYETHLDHHNTRHYGTHDDGEYLPLASGSWWGVVAFVAQIFYLPVLTFVRFLFVTPLSLVYPPLRRWVLEHWSSFVINLRFRRKITDKDPLKLWLAVEVACHLRVLLIFALIWTGIYPWYALLVMYGLAIGVLSLNHLRTLAAHRYRSSGTPMSHESQLLDSTDIVGGGLITTILCPVGLRYHALHHLFPGMPYHNLGQAHRRLMAELPADACYRQCVYPNIAAVVGELLSEIRANRRRAAIERTERPAPVLAKVNPPLSRQSEPVA